MGTVPIKVLHYYYYYYLSSVGNYSVAQSSKNTVKEYNANTGESNTTNPYPPISHPHTYTLKLMH